MNAALIPPTSTVAPTAPVRAKLPPPAFHSFRALAPRLPLRLSSAPARIALPPVEELRENPRQLVYK